MERKAILLVILASVVGLAGCSNVLYAKALEEGNIALANKEYDKALESFELVLDKDIEDEEVEEIYGIVKNYKKAKNYFDNGDIENTEKSLNKISDNYEIYPIKDDINKLKDKLKDRKKAIEEEKAAKEEEKRKAEEAKREREFWENQKVKELSYWEHRNLNIFFSNFSEAYFSNFDINDYDLGELIDFAYWHNRINNYGAIRREGIEIYIHGSHIQKAINKYFGIYIEHQSAGNYNYRNGRYYTVAADGGFFDYFSHVDRLANNEDGTYTADVAIYKNNDPSIDISVFYSPTIAWEDSYDSYEYLKNIKAVIKPAIVNGKYTYQLLNYEDK